MVVLLVLLYQVDWSSVPPGGNTDVQDNLRTEPSQHNLRVELRLVHMTVEGLVERVKVPMQQTLRIILNIHLGVVVRVGTVVREVKGQDHLTHRFIKGLGQL
tara:strand:- start:477 stop:782 length:306 start_codon:yes stop_codon:yes gene_type:complete